MADSDDPICDAVSASRVMKSSAVAAVVLAGVLLAAVLRPAGDAAEAARPEARSTSTAPLVFGIYPGGAAGTVGPAGRTRPEDPSSRLARLEQLRGGSRPFVLHLYDSFTSRADSDTLPPQLAEEIAGYLAREFQVELPGSAPFQAMQMRLNWEFAPPEASPFADCYMARMVAHDWWQTAPGRESRETLTYLVKKTKAQEREQQACCSKEKPRYRGLFDLFFPRR